jgi:2'-5' RNA ligase
MTKTRDGHTPGLGSPGTLGSFYELQSLRNHWARPVGPHSYYWYLTFHDHPELHTLVIQCQEAIGFPYYDLTPLNELHLTIDRIGYARDLGPDQLADIESAATCACQNVSPLALTIGSLGGTRGAVGFSALPAEPIRSLRNTLRAATISVFPEAPVVRSELYPHVTIAYSNSEGIPAKEVTAAVRRLRAAASVTVTVREAAIVLLERRERSYTSHVIARIRLSG